MFSPASRNGRFHSEEGSPPRTIQTRGLTSDQRSRLRRDIVICLARRHGASERIVADAHGLTRAAVRKICAKMEAGHAG